MSGITRITSRDNRRLTDARKVRDGKQPERIFIEGTRLAEEAVRSGSLVTDCIVSVSYLENGRGANLIAELAEKKVPIIETSDQLFLSLADTVNPQGLILIAQRPETGKQRLAEGALAGSFVFLHETNDPSNLGAVLRTAEAAGVAGILLSVGSADAFSPKALRAAMGSSFRLPIWDHVKFSDGVTWAHQNDIQVIAADISGDRSYVEIDWLRQSMVIFGSEANGLGTKELAEAHEIIRIPMQRDVDSLNLAVSSGIILFEAARQRSYTAGY